MPFDYRGDYYESKDDPIITDYRGKFYITFVDGSSRTVDLFGASVDTMAHPIYLIEKDGTHINFRNVMTIRREDG